MAPNSRKLSLIYLKQKVVNRIWGEAKRNKDFSALFDIFEVLVTSPFKTYGTQSFFDVAKFYGRFEPKGSLSLEFLSWLQRSLYDFEHFTEVELKVLYDSAVVVCAETRVKISKSTTSARLTLPIESVISTMSARLSLITLKS